VVDEAVDSLGCKEYLQGLAKLLNLSLQQPAAGGVIAQPSAIYLVGTGALGVGLDAVAAVFSPSVSVPIVRVQSHAVVRFAPQSVVIGASFAGDTPETTEHLLRAFDAGATVVLAAAHGPLIELVASRGGKLLRLDDKAPGPRWAMLQSVVVTLSALADLLTSSESQQLLQSLHDGVVGFDKRMLDDSSWEHAAKLARRIDRTMVLALGSGELAGVAAHRLASQVEENAKTFAVSFDYPELGYSTVAGFGQCGDLTRQVFTAVELCDDSEVPADARRRAVVADILDEQVATRITLTGEGESTLEQFFDLVAQVDQLSLCLAAHVGIDPGPVPTIVEVKQAAAAK
jgi:hypothetical protein